MKRIYNIIGVKHILILLLLLTTLPASAQKAKYVFYFIGDGMGVNQVNGTETYLAALEGRIGVKPLCFTQFPYAALVTTYSGTNGVTDSAAAGTALYRQQVEEWCPRRIGRPDHFRQQHCRMGTTEWCCGRSKHKREHRPRHARRFLCPSGRTRILLCHR